MLKTAALALFALLPALAHADTNYGPITLGDNSPFGEVDVKPEPEVNGGTIVLTSSGLVAGGGPGFQQTSIVNIFAFDINPGYKIVGINVTQSPLNQGATFPYTDPNPPPTSRNYRTAFGVCSVSDFCISGVSTQYAPAAGVVFPALPSLPLVGAGTGYLEQDAQTENWSYVTEGGGQPIFLFYQAVDPVPEPSSLVLIGTGLIGASGAARRRLTR